MKIAVLTVTSQKWNSANLKPKSGGYHLYPPQKGTLIVRVQNEFLKKKKTLVYFCNPISLNKLARPQITSGLHFKGLL